MWSAKEELGGSSGICSSSLLTLTRWHKTEKLDCVNQSCVHSTEPWE